MIFEVRSSFMHSVVYRNYSGILNNGPHGCFIDNLLRYCRRGFIPRSSKWSHHNRGINPLLQFSQSPSHENFLVSSYYPSAFILYPSSKAQFHSYTFRRSRLWRPELLQYTIKEDSSIVSCWHGAPSCCRPVPP